MTEKEWQEFLEACHKQWPLWTANRESIEVWEKWKGEKSSAEAFFGTLQHALNFLVDAGVRETKLADLKTIIAKQDELYRLIVETKFNVAAL